MSNPNEVKHLERCNEFKNACNFDQVKWTCICHQVSIVRKWRQNRKNKKADKMFNFKEKNRRKIYE